MSPTMELLYHYFVGPPDAAHWPEGLRLGMLLALECLGPDLLLRP